MEEFLKQIGSAGAAGATLTLLLWRVWKLEVGIAQLWNLLNGERGIGGRLARLEGLDEAEHRQ